MSEFERSFVAAMRALIIAACALTGLFFLVAAIAIATELGGAL